MRIPHLALFRPGRTDMLKIFSADDQTELGTSDLELPPKTWMVLGLTDDYGDFYRVKISTMTVDGETGMAIKDPRQAWMLPNFQPHPSNAPEKLPKKVESKLYGISHLGTMVPEVPGSEEIPVKVLPRVLRKLDQAEISLDEAVDLKAGVSTGVEVALPDLPPGKRFLKPDADLPLDMEVVLGMAALGEGDRTVLQLKSVDDRLIPAGTRIGLVEARSMSEVPEGMRDKIFQSHYISKVEEARAEIGE